LVSAIPPDEARRTLTMAGMATYYSSMDGDAFDAENPSPSVRVVGVVEARQVASGDLAFAPPPFYRAWKATVQQGPAQQSGGIYRLDDVVGSLSEHIPGRRRRLCDDACGSSDDVCRLGGLEKRRSAFETMRWGIAAPPRGRFLVVPRAAERTKDRRPLIHERAVWAQSRNNLYMQGWQTQKGTAWWP